MLESSSGIASELVFVETGATILNSIQDDRHRDEQRDEERRFIGAETEQRRP
jgi:hypothetical protein